MAASTSDRERSVFIAKLAKQAELYDGKTYATTFIYKYVCMDEALSMIRSLSLVAFLYRYWEFGRNVYYKELFFFFFF